MHVTQVQTALPFCSSAYQSSRLCSSRTRKSATSYLPRPPTHPHTPPGHLYDAKSLSIRRCRSLESPSLLFRTITPLLSSPLLALHPSSPSLDRLVLRAFLRPSRLRNEEGDLGALFRSFACSSSFGRGWVENGESASPFIYYGVSRGVWRLGEQGLEGRG